MQLERIKFKQTTRQTMEILEMSVLTRLQTKRYEIEKVILMYDKFVWFETDNFTAKWLEQLHRETG